MVLLAGGAGGVVDFGLVGGFESTEDEGDAGGHSPRRIRGGSTTILRRDASVSADPVARHSRNKGWANIAAIRSSGMRALAMIPTPVPDCRLIGNNASTPKSRPLSE